MNDYTPPDVPVIVPETVKLAPDQPVPPVNSPCPVCIKSGTAHRVAQSLSKAETEDDGAFFDSSGVSHVHSWDQWGRLLQCSNGHLRTIRYVIACPGCGWTIDTQIESERAG